MNVTQAELAARASISVKHVNQIMQGNAPITPETAMILDRITGTPVGFWNRREADYRENLLGITPKTLSPEDPLTAQGDPNEMVNICAEAGIVVVFVPEVQRCRISGAELQQTIGRRRAPGGHQSAPDNGASDR